MLHLFFDSFLEALSRLNFVANFLDHPSFDLHRILGHRNPVPLFQANETNFAFALQFVPISEIQVEAVKWMSAHNEKYRR